ncbi:MAG: N-acetylmuramoyl-L-alanine amidase [Syntrophales bacterium]|nr:N-acetylmuramoyl-L-alanine amidase [Syntrophales bacterium]
MKQRSLKRIVSLLIFLVFPLMVATIAMAGPPGGKHLVVIDPAHGGTEKGTRLSDRYYEKDATLNIALSLQKELSRWENIRVQLTRYTDGNIPIFDRIRIVRMSHPEVFISLHVNAGFGKNSTGYEVYFPGFKSTSTGESDTAEILRDMAKNKYLNDSVRLAQTIQKNMEKVFPRKGRGLRDAPIAVLTGLSIPAVVVEIGFATNLEEREKIMDETTQSAIVQALSTSIREYF